MSLRYRTTHRKESLSRSLGNGLRALILLCLLPIGCSKERKPPSKSEVHTVKAATAESLTTLEKEFVGLSTPDDAVNLAFRIGGQILDVPVSKGRSVSRGALIAELDPREVEIVVQADRTAFEEASSHLERMKRLLAHEAISLQEYEQAVTRHAQARSTYENSLKMLNDTKIRAPFEGVIEATYVDTYQRVSAGEPIARLVNPLTRTVSFTAPEGLVRLLDLPTTHFQVRFDNYRGVRFEARLKNHARTSSDGSGFPTSLTLVNPDTARYPIAPGMSCTILMQLADPEKEAVSVPLRAIYAPAGGGTWVWVIDRSNRVERHRVRVGNPVGRDRIAIDSGLRAGDRIVTAGLYQLKEGEEVRIIKNDNDEQP